MNGNFRFSILEFRLQSATIAAFAIGRIQNPKSKIQNLHHHRSAFTLTELMIVISIMAILGGLGAAAMTGATNLAREHRAGTMLDKIDQLIMERYEGYRTRTVPLKIAAGTPPRIAAMIRLNAIRDLMRMELPDRKSDVIDYFTPGGSPPASSCDCDPRAPVPSVNNFIIYMAQASLQKSYQRIGQRALGNNWPGGWTEQHQGSECLFLILSTMRDGDKSALDYFDATEIGDTDGDGMKEILDGWGTPIQFIRWPAGYTENVGPDGQWGRAGVDDDGDGVVDNISEAGWPLSDDFFAMTNTLITTPRTVQTKNYIRAPDPFDPVKVHAIDPLNPTNPATSPTLFGNNYTPGYNLHPLIVSAGPDKKFDIVFDQYDPALNASGPFYHYSAPPPGQNYPNPFVLLQNVTLGSQQLSVAVGTVGDVDGDGYPGYADNITNHDRASEE